MLKRIIFYLKNKLYRDKYKNINDKKIKEIKKSFKAIVMDQDGTLKGGNDSKYKNTDILSLIKRIVLKNKYPVVITGSGASALKSFTPLINFYQKNKNFKYFSTYLGIGNGTSLYRINHRGLVEIYSNILTLDEIKSIIEVWEMVYIKLKIKESDLKQKGLSNFKNFIKIDWNDFIPKDYLSIFKKYNGRCFTEKVKVTVVFPEWDEFKQRKLVKKIQIELDSILGEGLYVVTRGDDIYMHINKAFKIDPKLYALNRIMKDLNLNKNQVVVFGDMPLDNDKGILVDSELPFTFTNQIFVKKNQEKPPFFLPNSSLSPVGSVHKAIDYLLL